MALCSFLSNDALKKAVANNLKAPAVQVKICSVKEIKNGDLGDSFACEIIGLGIKVMLHGKIHNLDYVLKKIPEDEERAVFVRDVINKITFTG